MADDKTKTGGSDRSKVAGGEKYEVAYEAKKLGVSEDVVKAAIVTVGNDRAKIEAEIKRGK